MDRKTAAFSGVVISGAAFGVLLKAAGAPPNVEALMMFALPAAIVLGPVYGLANALAMRALYDGYMGWAGWWTILTSFSYGLAGLAAGYFGLWKRSWNRVEIVLLAAGLTLLYDVVTMLLFGLPFGIPLGALVVGQIPFTINHLIGNCLFCFVFSPLLLRVLQGYVCVKTEERAPLPMVLQARQKKD